VDVHDNGPLLGTVWYDSASRRRVAYVVLLGLRFRHRSRSERVRCLLPKKKGSTSVWIGITWGLIMTLRNIPAATATIASSSSANSYTSYSTLLMGLGYCQRASSYSTSRKTREPFEDGFGRDLSRARLLLYTLQYSASNILRPFCNAMLRS